MTISAFTFVSLYSRVLGSVAHVLKKGAEHAAANGVSEREMLNWRLIDDMQPLAFQVVVVCDFSRAWTARFAGLEFPPTPSADLSVAEFLAVIEQARAFLAGLTPEQFAGRDDLPLTVGIGDGSMKPTLPAEQWLTGFATTNIYFHLSTAYGILRSHGVPLGKIDLFSEGL